MIITKEEFDAYENRPNKMSDAWLVCGTRGKGYEDLVFEKLDKLFRNKKACSVKGSDWKPSIIEGCCPDSADSYAEKWAEREGIVINHFPSTSGNYLKRNIEMVNEATLVIAFWDGFSYGTAHTIAHAVMKKIPVIIYKLKKI